MEIKLKENSKLVVKDHNGNSICSIDEAVKEGAGKVTFNDRLEVPDTSDWESNKTIATEDYVDDALSEIEIGLNGKTYEASGATIELPDLAEVKGVPGNYPEYIYATVANGMAGTISWEELQASIDDGSINLAAHTFDAYITFYFPELLEKYGLYSFKNEGEPIALAYASIYPTEPPITMPDTVVDFATLKAWIIANIGTIVGLCYVDEYVFNNDEVKAYYNLENGIDDLNIAFKNGDLICEARLKGWSGVGMPIVGATNPPTVPGLESTFVGEFRGDAFAGKIKCDSVEAKTIYARNIGDASANGRVNEIHASNVGTSEDKVDIVFANYIGYDNNKALTVYAENIGSTRSKVDNVYASSVGGPTSPVNTIYANHIGSQQKPVLNFLANNIGYDTNPVERIYVNNIGGLSKPVANLYADNIGVKDKPVGTIYATLVGNSDKPVDNIYAKNIGVANNKAKYIFADNVGSSTSKVGSIYVSNIGSKNVPVNLFYSDSVGTSSAPIKNLYANNVVLNLPTSDPGVAGALWNDGGVLKISAGQ